MKFHNLGVVTDFINWAIRSPGLGIALLAILSPIAMVLFGTIVIERRRLNPLPPSYTLGSFFMIGTISSILVFAPMVDVSRWGWWMDHGPIVTLVIVLAFYLLMRKVIDGPMYEMTPGATANSASKIMYDISSYIIYPYVMILVGVPTVIESLRTNEVIPVMVGGAFPIMGVVIRALLPVLQQPKLQRTQLHPDDGDTWYRHWLNIAQQAIYAKRGGDPSAQYEALTMRYLRKCSEAELYSLRKRTESARHQAMKNIDNAENVVLRTEEDLAAIDAALLDKVTTSNND